MENPGLDLDEGTSVAFAQAPENDSVEPRAPAPSITRSTFDDSRLPRRILTIQKELIRLALDGADLDQLAQHVARCLENPVLVESRFGHVLTFASPLAAPDICPVPSLLVLRDPARRAEAALVFSGRAPVRFPPGSIRPGAPARIVAPIVVGGTVAYFSLVEQLRPADTDDGELSWQVAQVFGIVFARLRAALEVESRFRDNLLDALVLAEDVDETWAVARASLLEYDLKAPQSLLLLAIDPGDPHPVESSLVDLVELLSPWARGIGRGGVVVAKDEAVVVLLAAATGERGPKGTPKGAPSGGRRSALRPTARLDRATARLVDLVRHEIGLRYPDRSITVVAAPSVSDWRELRRAYRVARQSLAVLRLLGERGATISTADPRLALFFLLDGAAPGAVREFVERMLGTLLSYDRQHGRSLVETLETYLGEYGNLESTARRLNIHSSTLKYRLTRISELSGLDLRNTDHRFNVALALRLRALRSE